MAESGGRHRKTQVWTLNVFEPPLDCRKLKKIEIWRAQKYSCIPQSMFQKHTQVGKWESSTCCEVAIGRRLFEVRTLGCWNLRSYSLASMRRYYKPEGCAHTRAATVPCRYQGLLIHVWKWITTRTGKALKVKSEQGQLGSMCLLRSSKRQV